MGHVGCPAADFTIIRNHGEAQVVPNIHRRWNTIGKHLIVLVTIQLTLVLGLIAFSAAQDFHVARRDATGESASTAKLAADYVHDELTGMRDEMGQIPQFAALLASP